MPAPAAARSRRRSAPGRILALVAALGLASPAAAQMSAAERRQGAQAHPQLLAEFGGAYTGPGAAMVQRVGRQMAIEAGLTRDGSGCTVTLLNSTIPNAFAIPGCYVYVTRGLMALMNSEAELASVMGHEIGHVAARHGAKRQRNTTLAGIGAIAAAVLTGSGAIGQMAGMLGQSAVLSFSRAQEYEADRLGIQYMTRAGYDPRGAAEMLEALGAEERFQARLRGRDEAARVPAWMRTHPLTEERVRQARQLAAQARPQPGGRMGRDEYLAAIDGQLYGDDPEQGFVDGPAFAHPVLRFAFRAPQGFVLQNSPSAVAGQGPSGERFQFGGTALQPGASLGDYAQAVARRVVGNAQVQVGQIQPSTVNGVEAAILPMRAQTSQGLVDVIVATLRAGPDRGYHFILIGPAGRSQWAQALVNSFRRLSPAEAAQLRPRVIETVTVRPGDTIESLGARMAYSDRPVERFRVLNDLEDPGARLTPGQRVKLVRFAS
jgi:predicted Zn-dependent protease